jgi:hypothetical protein
LNYPIRHYEIVQNLLNGKFVLYKDEFYDIISDNYDFYKIFFKKSFKYTLIKKSEVIYLTSDNTSEKFSRNLMLILAVLVDNINLHGKDIYEELFKNYKINDIESIIKNSSYKSVCRNIPIEPLLKNECQKRNIINYNSDYDTFQFTNAISVFLEQAKDISNMNCKHSDGDI